MAGRPPALSRAERLFAADGVEQASQLPPPDRALELTVTQDLRADGRRRDDFRAVDIQLGVLPQAFGSARVRLGGTEVLVAVRAELATGSAAAPRTPRVDCVVELALGGAGGTGTDRSAAEARVELCCGGVWQG